MTQNDFLLVKKFKKAPSSDINYIYIYSEKRGRGPAAAKFAISR